MNPFSALEETESQTLLERFANNIEAEFDREFAQQLNEVQENSTLMS